MRYAGRAVFGAACLLAALSLAAVAHLDRRGGAAVDDAAGSAPGRRARTAMLAAVFRVADNDFGQLSSEAASGTHAGRVDQVAEDAEQEDSESWRQRDERELTRESMRSESRGERWITRESGMARALVRPAAPGRRRDASAPTRQSARDATTGSLPSEPSIVDEIERESEDADRRSEAAGRKSVAQPSAMPRARRAKQSSIPSEPVIVRDIERDGRDVREVHDNESGGEPRRPVATARVATSGSPFPHEPSVVGKIERESVAAERSPAPPNGGQAVADNGQYTDPVYQGAFASGRHAAKAARSPLPREPSVVGEIEDGAQGGHAPRASFPAAARPRDGAARAEHTASWAHEYSLTSRDEAVLCLAS